MLPLPAVTCSRTLDWGVPHSSYSRCLPVLPCPFATHLHFPHTVYHHTHTPHDATTHCQPTHPHTPPHAHAVLVVPPAGTPCLPCSCSRSPTIYPGFPRPHRCPPVPLVLLLVLLTHLFNRCCYIAPTTGCLRHSTAHSPSSDACRTTVYKFVGAIFCHSPFAILHTFRMPRARRTARFATFYGFRLLHRFACCAYSSPTLLVALPRGFPTTT